MVEVIFMTHLMYEIKQMSIFTLLIIFESRLHMYIVFLDEHELQIVTIDTTLRTAHFVSDVSDSKINHTVFSTNNTPKTSDTMK